MKNNYGMLKVDEKRLVNRKYFVDSKFKKVDHKFSTKDGFIGNECFQVRQGFDAKIEKNLVDAEQLDTTILEVVSGSNFEYEVKEVEERLLLTELRCENKKGCELTYYINSHYYRYMKKHELSMILNEKGMIAGFKDNKAMVICCAVRSSRQDFEKMESIEDYKYRVGQERKNKERIKEIETKQAEENALRIVKSHIRAFDMIAGYELRIIKYSKDTYALEYFNIEDNKWYTVEFLDRHGMYGLTGQKLLGKAIIDIVKNKLDEIKEQEVKEKNEKLIQEQIKTLSCGTCGTLLREMGYKEEKVVGGISYDATDVFLEDMIEFCRQSKVEYKCWQDVFKDYKETKLKENNEEESEVKKFRISTTEEKYAVVKKQDIEELIKDAKEKHPFGWRVAHLFTYIDEYDEFKYFLSYYGEPIPMCIATDKSKFLIDLIEYKDKPLKQAVDLAYEKTIKELEKYVKENQIIEITIYNNLIGKRYSSRQEYIKAVEKYLKENFKDLYFNYYDWDWDRIYRKEKNGEDTYIASIDCTYLQDFTDDEYIDFETEVPVKILDVMWEGKDF